MSMIAYDGQIELEEEDWEDEYDPDDGEEDEWECEFGDRCLMASVNHMRSECYTRKMAESWADEAEEGKGK